MAVVCKVSMCMSVDPTRGRRRAGGIDVKAVFDPANRVAAQAIVDSIPELPWDTNVHEHCAAITVHLQEELKRRFPVQKRQMRKDYLTAETTQVHRAMGSLKCRLRHRCQAMRWTLMRCVIQQWREVNGQGCRTQGLAERLRGSWMSDLRTNIALGAWHVKQLAQRLRWLCRRDKADFLRTLADEIGHAPIQDVQTACRRLLQPRKKRSAGNRPLPCLQRSDGSICTSPQEALECWREHFAALEAGELVKPSDLAYRCVADQRSRAGPEQIAAEHWPTLREVEQALRQVAPDRAAGPDGLPTRLCKTFCNTLSVKLFPFILKTVALSCEAIGHKGGTLFRLAKSGGDTSKCSGYRGVLAQCAFAKVAQKVTRGILTERVGQEDQPFRLGGRKGYCAGFGSLMVRCFLKYAKCTGRSAGIIFVDIVSAYYRVVRQLVSGVRGSEFCLDDVVKSVGLEAEDLQQLQFYIQQEPALASTDSEVLRCLAHEFHSHTWQVLHGDSHITWTKKGSRPGSSWADSIFSLLFARIMKRRDVAFEDAIRPAIPWDGRKALEPVLPESEPVDRVEVEEIIFADDLALLTLSADAGKIGVAVAEQTSSVVDVFASHALTANFSPNKTAAMVAPIGGGSRRAKQALFHHCKGRIPVLCENGPGVVLDLVPAYKHLGTTIDHRASMHPEVVRRVTLMRVAFREGKRDIYLNPRIPLERRVFLFRANVMSVLLYGSGTWATLLDGSYRLFVGAVMSLYRQLIRIKRHAEQHWTRNQICSAVQLPLPQHLLHVERLRFMCLLAQTGPPALWAALRYDAEYVDGLRRAAEWMHALVSATCPLPDPNVEWEAWIPIICSNPGRFKGWVKRAECAASLMCDCLVAAELAQREVWTAKPAVLEECSVTATHMCLPCNLVFDSRQAWGSHAARCHGYRARHTKAARGRICFGCGNMYANTHRLQRHLSNSHACLVAAERAVLRAVDTGVGHVQAPPVQCSTVDQAEGVEVTEPDVEGVIPELVAALSEASPVNAIEVVEVVRKFVGPFPAIRATVSAWGGGHSDPAVRHMADAALARLHPVPWRLLCAANVSRLGRMLPMVRLPHC